MNTQEMDWQRDIQVGDVRYAGEQTERWIGSKTLDDVVDGGDINVNRQGDE